MQTALRILWQSFAIVLVAGAVAIGTNLLRSDGIPLVADVEYDIFAPCEDSEAESQAASADSIADAKDVLYVDARPAEAFAAEHARGAINVPYSVLFGAAKEDLERLRAAVEDRRPSQVVVYGVYADPADPAVEVDLAEPLAEQLVERELPGVRHFEGGLERLKKSGVRTVQADEGGE